MNKSKGFTLIEVVIALALMSMLMVSIVAAMRTFGNTKTTISQVTSRVDEMRVVSDFLRKTLGAAMPVLRESTVEAALQGEGYSGTYFIGDSDQIAWVAPVLAGANLGGAYIMRLARVDDRLELTWSPYKFDLLKIDQRALKSRPLLHSVEEFKIGYLGDYGEEWMDEWPGLHLNPVAVRLNIKVGEKYWPELVVRLSGGELNEE
ncbi:MAG: general secretion pathway protein J [Halioglobus sp.]|jgi:general secretion pathway protein J